MLTEARKSPDIVNYLTYILSNGPLLGQSRLSPEALILVRSSAAISLKNALKDNYDLLIESDGPYIQFVLLSCLQDDAPPIRNFTGTIITEMVQRGGLLGWPELLPKLLSIAANDNGADSAAMQEGAMSALAKVCDDNKTVLDEDYQGRRPLQYLIPRLLEITHNPIAKVRALALASINTLIPQRPPILIIALDAILERLFELVHDLSDDVRRNVCRSFVLIVDVTPDKIQPHMEWLVDYMTILQKNANDPDLALEAAEFWLVISENEKACVNLGPYLCKVVPVLLGSMVYNEETIMRLQGDVDDAEHEDRVQDIRPRFASKTLAKTTINGQHTTGLPHGHNSKHLQSSCVDDDISIEDGEVVEIEEDIEVMDDTWNLRKCSAAALDMLATFFRDSIFSIALPYLKENLCHDDWPHREAAVLAIGALAEGCLDSMAPNLPELIPFLLSLLNDDEPSVRIITCWALGRYSGWASHFQDESRKKCFFEPMMDGILRKMLDRNKRVQESAASAFANLEERAGKELTPYCVPILQTFIKCFGSYKDRNIFILYDCVQTLAEQVGTALRTQYFIDLLMPSMIDRWGRVSDQSMEIFPLLECLSYIASALGDSFAPFAIPIFARCIRIIHQHVEHIKQYRFSPQKEFDDKPNKDFIITSLDLLSAVVQALDPTRSGELVTSSQPRFFDLLILCMKDTSNDVRQSSYALLGDCAVNIFPKLQPHLSLVIPVLIQQLDLDNLQDDTVDTEFSVINNACWSCGEIAIRHKQDMAPFVLTLYSSLITIIGSPGIPISLGENAVVALGRLGVHCHYLLAPRLADFAKPFLRILRHVENNDEKSHALLGLNSIVADNPQAMEGCLVEYFQAGVAFVLEEYASSEGRETVAASFQEVSQSSVFCIKKC